VGGNTCNSESWKNCTEWSWYSRWFRWYYSSYCYITLKANEGILSDGSSAYNYNNNGAIDNRVIDLVDGEDDSDDNIYVTNLVRL
jgi:hypothetical protein